MAPAQRRGAEESIEFDGKRESTVREGERGGGREVSWYCDVLQFFFVIKSQFLSSFYISARN